MTVFIETHALKAFLYGILSCKCPVTHETEKKLFHAFFKTEHETRVDYLTILAIADKNPERTPIHNLFDFCVWSRDNPSSFTITVNDVLRYLGSSFHYNMVVSNHPGIESGNPELLISHMLVPVSGNKHGESAVYQNGRAKIGFKHLIAPDDLEEDTNLYAMHMGVLLCCLSVEQAEMIYSHQNLIKGLPEILNQVNSIDFKALPPYGDHYSQVAERFNRHYR